MSARLVASLLAAATMAAAGCSATAVAGRPTPHRTVEVALVGTFSGPEAAVGRGLRNGLELEAAAINRAGGLLGSQVEVVAADGAADPARAADMVREQVGEASTGLVVGPDSTAAFRAARPALDFAGLPGCLTRVSDDAVGDAQSTFRVSPSNAAEVGVLLSALHRSRPDVRRVGLLDDGDDLGRSYDALLGAQAGRAGLTYVGRAGAGPDQDQRAALQQLAGQGAQVVVLSQQPVGAARAAQAALQLGSGRPQLAGFASLADYGFASLGGAGAVGALLVSTPQSYLTDLPQGQWPPGYRTFVAGAGRQYGLGTDGFQLQASPAAADCLRQWARAVVSAGTFGGAAVVRAWERLDLAPEQTALGVRERVAPGDHTSVAQDGVFAYTWARDGSRYRLRSVPTS